MSRLEQLSKIVAEANKGLASYDEVKKLFDMLNSAIKAVQEDFTNKSEVQQAKMLSQLTETINKAEVIVKSLEPKIEKLDSDLRSELRTVSRMHEQNLSDMRDELMEEMGEEYDDAEIRGVLEELKKSIPEMPESFDPSDIMEDIEELEDRVEKLENRPVGKGGGGATAMGVAAMFKHIGKTEAPVGAIDGVNTTYTVSSSIWWIAGFTINGEQAAELPNFTFSGNTITFSTPIPAVFNGKDIEVKYIGT